MSTTVNPSYKANTRSARTRLLGDWLHWLVGCFPSAKQSQLKDLEKTIHVLKAYVAKPLALCFNGGKNVLLLVGPLIVGLFDLLPCFISESCLYGNVKGGRRRSCQKAHSPKGSLN